MIGIVLGKLINILLQRRDPTKDPISVISQQLSTELDIDFTSFLLMEEDAALDYLINVKKFSLEHLRVFGNLLYSMATETDDAKVKQKLTSSALAIYKYISANGKGTMYLDVEYRVKELKNA